MVRYKGGRQEEDNDKTLLTTVAVIKKKNLSFSPLVVRHPNHPYTPQYSETPGAVLNGETQHCVFCILYFRVLSCSGFVSKPQ